MKREEKRYEGRNAGGEGRTNKEKNKIRKGRRFERKKYGVKLQRNQGKLRRTEGRKEGRFKRRWTSR